MRGFSFALSSTAAAAATGFLTQKQYGTSSLYNVGIEYSLNLRMGRKYYNTEKLEVIYDIYGEPCYVTEIKWILKHNVEVYYGRPVRNTPCKHKIILTHELVRFIKDTIDQPQASLDVPFTLPYLSKLRRLVQNNPFESYQKWLDTPSRPSYVVFANTMEDPEYVYDYFDRKFILYSACMTALDIPILTGVDEPTLIRSKRAHPEYLLTKELADLIAEYRYRPKDLVEQLPFDMGALHNFRNQLGYHLRADRNAWFAARIDDLIELKPTEFYRKHAPHQGWTTIYQTATSVRVVSAMTENGTLEDVRLLALLEEDWSKANEVTRKAVDKHYSVGNSKRIRRAYRILKLANRI